MLCTMYTLDDVLVLVCALRMHKLICMFARLLYLLTACLFLFLSALRVCVCVCALFFPFKCYFIEFYICLLNVTDHISVNAMETVIFGRIQKLLSKWEWQSAMPAYSKGSSIESEETLMKMNKLYASLKLDTLQ